MGFFCLDTCVEVVYLLGIVLFEWNNGARRVKPLNFASLSLWGNCPSATCTKAPFLPSILKLARFHNQFPQLPHSTRARCNCFHSSCPSRTLPPLSNIITIIFAKSGAVQLRFPYVVGGTSTII